MSEKTRAKILWVEGKRADSPSFVPGLRKKDFSVEVVPTGSAALERVVEVCPDLVVVNAATLRSSGTRICHALRKEMNGLPIILITPGEQKVAPDVSANVVLKLPFTVRKLVNRIAPFVPGEGEEVVHAGPIRLDLGRKKVRCQGREARLTPRLTNLLHVLMRNQGEVVSREVIFTEIWDTDWTADTRTLDVHISWLRHAIEEDPRKPRYLKTIRRVGYRLDV